MSEKKEIKRKEKELNLLKTNFSEKNFLTFEKVKIFFFHFLLPLPSCIEREIVMGERKEEEEGKRERKKVGEKEEKEHSFFILFLAYEAFFHFSFSLFSSIQERERESE